MAKVEIDTNSSSQKSFVDFAGVPGVAPREYPAMPFQNRLLPRAVSPIFPEHPVGDEAMQFARSISVQFLALQTKQRRPAFKVVIQLPGPPACCGFSLWAGYAAGSLTRWLGDWLSSILPPCRYISQEAPLSTLSCPPQGCFPLFFYRILRTPGVMRVTA
jgi:hypothetical protein